MVLCQSAPPGLGNIGFDSLAVSDITEIDQTLDMWKGELIPISYEETSGYGNYFRNGDSDIVSASVSSSAKLAVGIRFLILQVRRLMMLLAGQPMTVTPST